MNSQKAATSSELMADKVLQEMEKDESASFEGGSNSILLPSALQPNQVAKLKFREADAPLTCTVRGVHFYIGKVKYDLGLWLGDGTVDSPEYETRIYNVDSVFLTPA